MKTIKYYDKNEDINGPIVISTRNTFEWFLFQETSLLCMKKSSNAKKRDFEN